MSLDQALIKKTHELKYNIQEDTKEFVHNRPLSEITCELVLPDQTKHGFLISHKIKDVLLLSGITHSSVLMTGGTDSGKTTLARLVMNSLFGKEDENWHRIDFDLDFGKDTYTDIDFSTIIEGKKVSEGMYNVSPYLVLPGLIADEMNRSHARLVNKAMHIFDKDIALPDGRRVKVGVDYGNNNLRYQYQIAAINEGGEYVGTFDIDRALRRRTVVEIPMDVFTPTRTDRLLISKQSAREIELPNTENRFDYVIDVFKHIEKDIKVHPNAEMFKSYLEAFDYCKHSLTGEKGSVPTKAGSIAHICTQKPKIPGLNNVDDSQAGIGCEFMRTFSKEGMCPNVRGITSGISKNLDQVAKGFAVMRAIKFLEMIYSSIILNQHEVPLEFKVIEPRTFKKSLQDYVGKKAEGEDLVRFAAEKYFSNLEVEICDIEAAIGFVGYSKIGISPQWTLKNYQGNQFAAVKDFVNQAKKKFEEGRARPELEKIVAVLQGKASNRSITKIQKYCKDHNPWMWQVIHPYLNLNNFQKVEKQKEILHTYR